MKNLKYFVILLFYLLGFSRFVSAQTYDLYLQTQYNHPNRDQIFVDLFIKTTSGSWNLASANFVVDFNESEWSFLGRDLTFDGPWDNGANPSSYLDMGSNVITILGDKCVNVTLNPITGSCPPTNGVSVPAIGTRIARLIFNRIGDCGSDPGIQWKTGPGTGTINRWNASCTITNVKPNATFVQPPSFHDFSTNDPVCSDANYVITINSPVPGYNYEAYKNGDYLTPLGTWSSPTITIPASSLNDGDEITVRGIHSSNGTIYVLGCYDEVDIDPVPSVSIVAISNPVCVGGIVTFTATPVNGGVSPSYQWKKNGNNITGATLSTYVGTEGTDFVNGDVISVEMTASTSCTTPVNSNTITMTVDAVPSVTIAASSNPVCDGGTVMFTATPVNGGGSPSYQWKKNGNDITGETSSTYSGTAGTDFVNGDVISVVMTASTSCTTPVNSNPITMTVNPGFFFSPAPLPSACLNDIVHLTLNTTVPGASWSVSPGTDAAVVLSNNNEAYIQFKSGANNVTVIVTDNVCTISHNFTVNPTVKINLKALLNGANDGSGGMNANIISVLKNVYENGNASTPYAGGSLQGALGTSGAMAIPNDGGAGNAVDVVQIELRDQTNPNTIVATTYGFIMADGDVRDFPGGASTYVAISDVNFCGVLDGDYYVVVKHRNHLPIRSANPITLTNSNSFTVGVVSLDLTNPANVYNSSSGFCNIDAGKAYMWEGNVYDDALVSDLGEVNATDFFIVSTKNDIGATGYVTEDIDLDGDVDAVDFNMIQNGNNNLYFTDIPNPQLNHP